ncbi:endocuticle structural glycoprotein SgAbd-5-like [Lycorma delicatula]|uniref:endocuticle structural glycoprotein SgAbd-5-like n=1 Tax=Lycorma delicatula TaxID=130591 RepID=UPI003F515160
MYYILFITLLFSVYISVIDAAPQSPQDFPHSEIISQYNELNPDGTYKYGFETNLGIKKDETGQLKDVPNEDNTAKEPAIVSQGSFSYIGSDGKTHKVDYVADENGFSPKITTT